MIVEEQGIGFRTGVRFPSAPRKALWIELYNGSTRKALISG